MGTTNEADTTVLEQERRTHQAAEHLAHQAAFPVGTRVHLATNTGELLRDLDDTDRAALYEVTAVTTAPTYPVWSLRTLGSGADLDQVVGDRLRHA